MRARDLCLVGVLAGMGASAQSQCLPGSFDSAVRNGPVRLIAHVDTDALVPASPNVSGGGGAGAAPAGASPGAVALGTMLGYLLINRINTAQQEKAVKRIQWMTSALDQAQPGKRWLEALSSDLAAEGYSQLNVDKDADPLDMEQPGLLKRITEPYTMTAHVQYGWTGDALRVGWARLRLKLWPKGGFEPSACREYVYLGGDLVAKEADASDGMQIDQMLLESRTELASMVKLDIHQSLVTEPAKPVTALIVKLPALSPEPPVNSVAMVAREEKAQRWIAIGNERWWSIPRGLADFGATAQVGQ